MVDSSATCPISGQRMSDPVIDRCGHTFERTAIMRWLQAGRRTCPLGREPLCASDLTTNIALRNVLEGRDHDRFRLEVSYASNVLDIGEGYSIEVEVVNLSKTNSLPESIVASVCDGYHEEGVALVQQVKPLMTVETSLHMPVKGQTTPEQFPTTFALSYADKTFWYHPQLSRFTKSIRDKRPRHSAKFNLLVYGLGGAGKSSLINKFATLLSDNHAKPNLSFAPVGAGDRHITKKLVRYALPSSLINVWDTWGFSGDNYQDDTLAHIFEGRLPSNWEMGDMKGSRLAALAEGQATKHQRRMHAAILVVDHARLESERDVEAIQSNFKQFTGFTPIIVVNKVDELLGSSWRDQPSGTKCVRLKKKAADACLANPNSVFLNVNYVIETCRDAVLDRQALMILDEAVARAEQFEQQHGSPAASLPHDIRIEVGDNSGYEW